MNKLNLVKKILFVLAASLLTLVLLVVFIKSFYVDDDGYGTTYGSNLDYFVLLVIAVCVLIYSITYLLNKNTKKVFYTTFGIATCLGSLYPLGLYFKNLAKGKDTFTLDSFFSYGLVELEDKTKLYGDACISINVYLFVGLTVLFLFAGIVVATIVDYKNHNLD